MFTQSWFPQNIPSWEKLLDKFKGQPNLHFLEIGCFEGQATQWLLQNILTITTSTITVIDTFEGNMEFKDLGISTENLEGKFRENIADKISQVNILKGKSQEILRDVKDPFDFVYIDGSHTAPDVLEDAVLSWRLLKKGGIMIFDDYLWFAYSNPNLNPHPAIDVFISIYMGQFKLLSVNNQMAIEKVV